MADDRLPTDAGPRATAVLPGASPRGDGDHEQHSPDAPAVTRAGGPRRRRSVWLAGALALVLALVLLVPALLGGPRAAEDAAPGPVRVATPPGDLTREDLSAWLDGTLAPRLEAAGVVGAEVSVVADGQVLLERGYGSSEVGGDPVDPSGTVFRVASVTKTVTATAAMQLVEDGRLELDTDVARYLDVPLPRSFDEPVTLRHLLTHTAGFEERIDPLVITDPARLGSLREVVTEDPPEQVFAPGTTPAYSNYGMALVGYLVERVSEQPYEQYVQQEVLDPLGMTSSSVAQPPPAELAERASAGYRDGGRTETPFELIAPGPAGALSTTGSDMARFMLAHLQGGELDGERVLDPETVELMQAPALGADELGGLAGGERMGLGLFREDRGGHRVIAHGGDSTAFHSHLQLYPDDGVGLFMAINSTGSDAAATYTVRQQLVDGFTDRYFPDQRAERPTLETSAAHAEQAAGSYLSSRRSESTFVRALDLSQATVAPGPDGTVEVSTLLAADGTAKRWREVEPWVFQEVGGQDVIAMRVDGGRVVAITHDGAFTLTRAEVPAGVGVAVGGAGVAVLLLTVLAWPVAALVRRHHGVRRHHPVRARRLARGGAVLVLLALAGWAAVIAAVFSYSDPSPVVLRGLQVLLAAGLLTAAVAGVRDAWLGWRRRTGWFSRVWAAAVVAAVVATGWFGVTYGLLAPSITY